MQKQLSGTAMPRAVPAPCRAHIRSSGRQRIVQVKAAVQVGDKAPDFSLPDQNGKNIKLSSFQGLFGKPVVLYFYPADNSSGCTKQANAFKTSAGAFSKAGAVVLGVSKDDVDSHVEFRSKLDLPFSLLADEGGKVRKEWGIPKDFLGLLDGRQTYVIDKSGVVKAIHNNQFDPESHVGEALAALGA
ncbi:hypothetical protein WJX73_009861 [Symbiochloris irregularis]|uniref:thioredoxin-dependent peroxiredoxin n=1 Tax=Symbiochloris irregularis TaxID=706552 RepID=A0AAW1NSA7_9CHLO